MSFRAIGEIVRPMVVGMNLTDSPIENQIAIAMLKRPPFVLCDLEDEPQGEGYFVFPQAPVGPYFADFLIKARTYIPGARKWAPKLSCELAIECDGYEFHSTPEQITYDGRRDVYFKSQGIDVLRFTGAQIHSNAWACLDLIEDRIKDLLS